ncbi:ATP-binding cassette domain-containing protein [Heyndrickxia oleronia]|uniref:ABC transporter ATP-binding protein n=1 Tax=Heyndrickxia oleronia TaxID=38875 RepID=UPI001C0EB759|nr:ABC transporter ATP-binding protein [Heyndrickxia oleronia]MBU5210062.1 ABC transporter ATP-binding protein [Heyndrickxia oleronia]
MSILKIKNLKKEYKGKTAVDTISFSLEEGKCTALLGPNGAGKTTTLNMIAGLITPTSGEVFSPNYPNQKDLRGMIGFLPQYPAFYDWMSGEEYLSFVGRLTNIESNRLNQRIDELIEVVGLMEGRKRRIGQYSGGMKQRLGIAQALIHKPQILILDEPVSALDPFGRREIIDLIKLMKTETTILFSTHILNDAEEVCDQVLLLNNGELIENGNIVDVRAKHSSQMIRLTFSTNPKLLLSRFQKYSWVEKIEQNEKVIVLYVKDLQVGRQQLLKMASEENWPLDSFDLCQLSLEEIFRKVVKE